MDYTLLRKITIKAVYGVIDRPKEGDEPVSVMNVIGIVSGVRVLEDKFKPGQFNYALTGQFEATNARTGEIFMSPQCFLPEPYQSMAATQFKDGRTEGLQLALAISYKHSKNAIGYEYVTKPLIKMSGVDALASIRAQISKPEEDVVVVESTSHPALEDKKKVKK